MGIRATVRNGRLLVDQANQLPEGKELDLVIDEMATRWMSTSEPCGEDPRAAS